MKSDLFLQDGTFLLYLELHFVIFICILFFDILNNIFY